MQKIKTYSYLKKYREAADFSLQDIAAVIGISNAALSKIEQGLIQPSIEVILAYHYILDVPIPKLFKQHIKESLDQNLTLAIKRKEYLLDLKTSPFIYKRLDMIDIIIKRLATLVNHHEYSLL